MPIPKDIFGKCPVCGGGGTDDPNSDGGFSTEDHTGQGYRLRYYPQGLMCQLCHKEIVAREEGAKKSEKLREQQRFWDKVGVKKHMDR